MARAFIIRPFGKEKDLEVAQSRRQYKRVPIIPIAREDVSLPITMVNSFSAEELQLLVRYRHIDDLLQKVRPSIIEPAEERVRRIAETIARSEAILLGAPTSSADV